MAKLRTGYVFKDSQGWWARVTVRDAKGTRRNIKRRVKNKSEGRELLKDILRELDDHGSRTLLNAAMTFETLAAHYETTYLVEPQYVDGRKIAGLRSYYSQRLLLKVLRAYFGKHRLCDITVGQVEDFKSQRLKTPKNSRKQGGQPRGQRAIASVNRELALLRRMLNFAIEQEWLSKNPFSRRKAIISTADERKRERILTREEEARLLWACQGRCTHLRPILICALDTGMRRGEILKLKWPDVDLHNSRITVRAFNTKSMRERYIAMTGRLRAALASVYALSTKDPEGLCFGITDVKKSFESVRKAAGLPGVRFHDLRHTVATRLVGAGLALGEVGRILGHEKPETTYRYVNLNEEAARKAATALEMYNST